MPLMKPLYSLNPVNARQVGPRLSFSRGTAWRRNRLGIVVPVAANEPCIDHDPVTRACLGLPLWESRTNQFQNRSTGASSAATVTLDAGPAIGPDGNPAHKLVPNAGAVSFPARTGVVIPNATSAGQTTDYSFVAALAATGPGGYVAFFAFDANISGASNVYATVAFNPATGLFSGKSLGIGWSDVIQPTAVRHPLGMWIVTWTVRWTQQATLRTAVTHAFQVREPGLSGTWNADGVSGISYACCQLEVGMPSPYIDTAASQVTRSADVALIGSSALSGLLRPEGYSVVASVLRPYSTSTFQTVWSINDATADNRVSFGFEIAPGNRATVLRNTAASGLVTTPQSTQQALIGRNRVAVRVAPGDVALSLNGASAVRESVHTMAASWTQMEIGRQLSSSYLNGWLEWLHIYPPLTDAELQAQSAL